MGLRKFKFAGTSSSAYNLFITEAATYNVPERAVEMLEIPGRNGAYALDMGRFQNVEVTYHVVVHSTNNSGFQTEFSDVRNWLASQVGYQRLEDDYNSGVYRMAIFKGGLETSEAFVNGAEFDIVFECKPQRWLTSGETATAVANNGTLSNPTLFDSEPLLAVKGYGTIGFNGYEVEIGNVTIGDIVLYGGGSSSSITLDESNLNLGDTITVNGNKQTMRLDITSQRNINTKQATINSSFTCSNADFTTVYAGGNRKQLTEYTFNIDTLIPSFSIVVGTNSTVTNTVNGTIEFASLTPHIIISVAFTQTFTYNATTHKLTYTTTNSSATLVQGADVTIDDFKNNTGTSPSFNDIIGHSTKSAVTDTVYIDCDIGECYTYNSADELVSLNGVISLGSDLPKLASGTNTFTYDNTVTELKVTPRWWKV